MRASFKTFKRANSHSQHQITVLLSLLVYEGIRFTAFNDLRTLVAQNCLDVNAFQTALFCFFQSQGGPVVLCHTRNMSVKKTSRRQLNFCQDSCLELGRCQNPRPRQITIPRGGYVRCYGSGHRRPEPTEQDQKGVLQASAVQRERARGYSATPGCPAAESPSIALIARQQLGEAFTGITTDDNTYTLLGFLQVRSRV